MPVTATAATNTPRVLVAEAPRVDAQDSFSWSQYIDFFDAPLLKPLVGSPERPPDLASMILRPREVSAAAAVGIQQPPRVALAPAVAAQDSQLFKPRFEPALAPFQPRVLIGAPELRKEFDSSLAKPRFELVASTVQARLLLDPGVVVAQPSGLFKPRFEPAAPDFAPRPLIGTPEVRADLPAIRFSPRFEAAATSPDFAPRVLVGTPQRPAEFASTLLRPVTLGGVVALAGQTAAIGRLFATKIETISGSVRGQGNLSAAAALAASGSVRGAGRLLASAVLAESALVSPQGRLLATLTEPQAGSARGSDRILGSLAQALTAAFNPAGRLTSNPNLAIAASARPSGRLLATLGGPVPIVGTVRGNGRLIGVLFDASAPATAGNSLFPFMATGSMGTMMGVHPGSAAAGPVPQVFDRTFTDSALAGDGTGVNNDIEFDPDGQQLRFDNNVVQTSLANWLTPTTPGAGAGFYIRLTKTGGGWTAMSFIGSITPGVWTAIPSIKSFSAFTTLTGVQHTVATLLVEISASPTGPAAVSATYTFDFTVT